MKNSLQFNELLNKRQYSILIISLDLNDPGGVAHFCRLLLRHMPHNFKINHFRVGNRPKNSNKIKQILYFFYDLIALAFYLMHHRFDLVQLNPSFRILSLIRDSIYTLIITRIFSRKTIVMFHGWDDKLAEIVIHNTLLKNLFRFIYSRVSFIVALGERFKDQIIKLGLQNNQVKVVPMMVEVKNNGSVLMRRVNRKILILFMSRIVKAKGIFLLPEIARLLSIDFAQKFQFIVAGDGAHLTKLKQCVTEKNLSEYFQFPGYVIDTDKENILRKCHIFLLPSYTEGFPVVILEAMAAGLAVVSSSAGAIPEVVKDGENGLLATDMLASTFSKKIAYLIQNPKILRSMARKNIEKVKTYYRCSVVLGKINDLYISALNS